MTLPHEPAMREALASAREAAARGEVPVGAAVVDAHGRVLAVRSNETVGLRDPTAHAEILALRDAAASVGNERLVGATLVVTLEPCAMCAGAAVWARVARIVYGASDPKAGACGSVLDVAGNDRLNHRPVVEGGLLEAEAAALLVDFFRSRR